MTGASRHEAPPQRPATSTPGRLLRRIAALLLLVYALGYAAIRLSGVIRLSDGVIAGRVRDGGRLVILLPVEQALTLTDGN